MEMIDRFYVKSLSDEMRTDIMRIKRRTRLGVTGVIKKRHSLAIERLIEG